MSFADRLSGAKQFEVDVESYLNSRKSMSAVAVNGTEHTHPDFVDRLRRNNSTESKFVRFAPDGVCLSASGTVTHWEAKASKNIEKDAYETYMKYSDMGCSVVIFAKHPSGIVYCQYVHAVGFIPSSDVVGKYGSRGHPIDECDWICPRMGHGDAGRGSGTSYREIDFLSMNEVVDF